MKFNLSRFSALLYRDFVLYRKSVGLMILALCLFSAFLLFTGASENSSWAGYYLVGLFFVGSIFTASNFMDFRESTDRIVYLSLPASNLEKYATHFVYCIIGFPIIWMLTFWMSMMLANVMLEFFTTDMKYTMFNPFNVEEGLTLVIMRYWLLAQSILFVFSIMFNRYAFVKSGFSFLLIAFGFIAICVIIFILIYGKFLPIFNGETDRLSGYIIEPKPSTDSFFDRMNLIQQVLTQYFLPPFLFVVAYFKLAEKEA